VDKVRFGIIGLGDIGRGHLKCLLHCKQAEIKALCDVEPRRVKQVDFFGIQQSDIQGLPFETDYKRLLENPEIDAVVIGVPGYLHRKITVDALNSGKHVLVEKPLAHTLEDAKAIIEAQKASGKLVQVGLVYRYSPFYRKMYDIIKKGALDQVQMMWCKEYRQPFPQMDWFYDKSKSGGAIVEKNTHHFDIFSWMIESTPTKVVAFGGQNVIKDGKKNVIDCTYCAEPPKIISKTSIIDNAFITVEYENGARANLGLCLFVNSESDSQNTLEMGAIGSNGLELMGNINTGRLKVCSGDPKRRKDYGMKITGLEFGHNGALESHKAFIDSVLTGTEPVANLNVALESLRVALAAEKSIEQNRIIEMSEIQ
jgi:myo-inositol 2-dehydrogenase / D-chiro-inositol 1-dehydrogenase